MRILDIRQLTVGLVGDVSNSVVSFGDHTVSLVAVISDQMRGGSPVVGQADMAIERELLALSNSRSGISMQNWPTNQAM